MNQLRANHFRTAEKALIHLRHFFTPERSVAARDWQSAAQSVSLLQRRVNQYEDLERRHSQLESDLSRLESDLALWRELSATERSTLRSFVARVRDLLEGPVQRSEAEILERYQIYQQLKGLVPYAEQVEHLCAAVKHYARRDEYESERKELEARIESSRLREKSVWRGFVLALCLCILVVTIPLCVPFAFSLWNRRREIQGQRAQLIESRRRVMRRLELAAEGVIAAEDITAVLGERSLADVRGVLEEVGRLHQEFTVPTDAAPAVTRVLVIVHRDGHLVTKAFGEPPKALQDFRERMGWFLRTHDTRVRQAQDIIETATAIVENDRQMKTLLKGYNPPILRDTISRLEDRMESIETGPVSRELFGSFARLCRSLPRSIDNAQMVLSQVSYGQDVTTSDWTKAGLAIVSASNTLGAIIAEFDLEESSGTAEDSASLGGARLLKAKGLTGAAAGLRSLALMVLVCGSFLPSVGWDSIAHAQESANAKGTSAALDYARDRIDVSGLIKPPAGGLAGLEAEIQARRNALESLAEQLQRICKEKSLDADWKQAMRSTGSEIYADKTFRIMLSGRLSEVISAVSLVARAKITNSEGRPIIFKMPSETPLGMTQCGALELGLENGSSLRVFPLPERDAQDAVVVALRLDQARGVLVGGDTASKEAIARSNLATLQAAGDGQVYRLPVQAP